MNHADDALDVRHPAPIRPAHLAQAAFLVFAVGLWAVAGTTDVVHTAGTVFVSIVLEALPFMLLGALVGGAVEVFVPRERILKFLPHGRRRTVLIAAGLGIIFPVCECAVVPVVRRLLRKGAPVGAAVAYLLGGPIVNPIVAASTAVAYAGAWQVVLLRVGAGYAVAVTAGFLMEGFFGRRALAAEHTHDAHAHHDHSHEGDSFRSRVLATLVHASDDFFDIGRFLVMGAFCAGLLQAVVSRQAFAAAAERPLGATLAMMALAVLLNLCSEADAFVAASFAGAAVPLVAQMGFMVLGPMLDIKLLLMYTRLFRRRAIWALAGITFCLVFAAMALIAAVLP